MLVPIGRHPPGSGIKGRASILLFLGRLTTLLLQLRTEVYSRNVSSFFAFLRVRNLLLCGKRCRGGLTRHGDSWGQRHVSFVTGKSNGEDGSGGGLSGPVYPVVNGV